MKNQNTFSTNESTNDNSIELILNNLGSTYIFVGRDFKVKFINELTVRQIMNEFGVAVTAGYSIVDLVAPDRTKDLIDLYEDVFSGTLRVSETEIPQKDGTKKYIQNSFRPAYDKNNQIIGAVVTSIDITARKTEQKLLLEEEERWRYALEGSNQGVWDWNLQTNEIIYSSSYKKMYGFAENEIQNSLNEWSERIHPDDKKMVDEAIKYHLQSDDPFYESVYRLKAKNNKYKWILARGMLVTRDSNGKPLRMTGTHTDITDRIKAEESYKLLFYNNPLPMWTYNYLTLEFTDVNNAAVRHYGYSRDEFLNMSINDIRPEEDLLKSNEALMQRNKEGHLHGVWKHKKKNGEIISAEISTYKFEREDDHSVLVLANDITENLRMQDEIKKSNERFSLISHATSDAIYDWDLTKNEQYWGEGLHTLFGHNPSNFTIDKWESLIHPKDRDRILKNMTGAIKNPKRKLWKKEYWFCKSDGTYGYVMDRGFIIRNKEGEPLRMLGSMQDISELKYNEQLLSLERSIFELSSNPNLEFKNIVDSLLVGIEDIYPDAFTAVTMLRENGTVYPLSSPRLPLEFSQRLDGSKLNPEDGSDGAAIAHKKTIIVTDINNDPLWKKNRRLAIGHGFKACLSLPIVHSSGDVIGTFSIYYKKVHSPATVELNTFERIRNILRILMEHYISLNQIKLSNERFDIVKQATHDLIWDWDLESNTIYRDDVGLKTVYGVADNEIIKNVNDWLNRIHVEDREHIQKVIGAIIQAKDHDNFDVEYRFEREDGTYSYIYDRGRLIRNKEGRPIRMIGAAQDITERKRLEKELLRTELERQKAINQATVETQEQERSEIGKELHDNVNQVLTTTKLYLDLALTNPELKDELITKSSRNIITVINEIRQLSRSLMDPSIGDLGLIDSINDLINNINLTRKLHVRLSADKQIEGILNKNQKLTIFRIIQEALNNAIKHAKASTVTIAIKHNDLFAQIVINDDGIGFHPDSVKKGAGLKNIQNRIYLINGTHTIDTAPEKGCKILIKFPIQ